MPGAERATRLSSGDAAAVCLRLASTCIALPTSLYKNGDPTADATRSYLVALLASDPASFLERYGKHLTGSELRAFEPLCHDYEVRFWHSSLLAAQSAAAAASTTGQPGAAAKNRRLAAMQQLHDAGEYFSLESMQERDPALYHQYIGQYAEQEEERAEQLSEALVRRHQQAQMRAQRQQMEEEEEEQVSEHDSDDDSDDGGDGGGSQRLAGGQQQQQRQPENGMQVDDEATAPPAPAPALRGSAIRGIPAGGFKPVTAASPKGRGGLAAAAQARPVAAAAAAAAVAAMQLDDEGTRAAGPSGQQRRPAASTADGGVPVQGPAAAAGRAPEDQPTSRGADGATGLDLTKAELEDKQREFVQEMEARFLCGADVAHGVDYVAIDADEQLDDHWLEQRGRDAEDKYFEGAEEEGVAAVRDRLDGAGQGPGLTTGGAGSEGAEGEMEVEQAPDAAAVPGGNGEGEPEEEWERMAKEYAAVSGGSTAG